MNITTSSYQPAPSKVEITVTNTTVSTTSPVASGDLSKEHQLKPLTSKVIDVSSGCLKTLYESTFQVDEDDDEYKPISISSENDNDDLNLSNTSEEEFTPAAKRQKRTDATNTNQECDVKVEKQNQKPETKNFQAPFQSRNKEIKRKQRESKKRKREVTNLTCKSCGAKESTEWRKGPDKLKSLCNACGLHFAKIKKKEALERQSYIESPEKGKISYIIHKDTAKESVKPKGPVVVKSKKSNPTVQNPQAQPTQSQSTQVFNWTPEQLAHYQWQQYWMQHATTHGLMLPPYPNNAAHSAATPPNPPSL